MTYIGTATPTSPFLFACDSIYRRGTIVDRKGPYLLIEGLALDQGSFVKHEGGFQKFDSREDAMELIGEMAQDAELKIEKIGPWTVSENLRTHQWEIKGPEGTYVRPSEQDARSFARMHASGKTGYDVSVSSGKAQDASDWSVKYKKNGVTQTKQFLTKREAERFFEESDEALELIGPSRTERMSSAEAQYVNERRGKAQDADPMNSRRSERKKLLERKIQEFNGKTDEKSVKELEYYRSTLRKEFPGEAHN